MPVCPFYRKGGTRNGYDQIRSVWYGCGRYGKDITKNDQAMEHIHEIADLIYQHPLEQSACGIYISVACQILGGTQAGVMAALDWFLSLIEKTIELAESDVDDLIAIHTLGSGWCGDDALAIAIYCALKYSNDFDKALIAAVNHGGDSDFIGAITGNILGAYLGLSAIPEKYTRNLELLEVIIEIADALYYRCNLYKKFHCAVDPRDIAWEEKYVYITYRKKRC